MYLTISPQKLSQKYSSSSADFVTYLEKENQSINADSPELFFNQDSHRITSSEVIEAIDGNVAKLKRTEPRYYSITINPSQRELNHIGNDKQKLITYTREVMKNYAAAFNRQIHGRPVSPKDILFFGKVEFSRTFKGTDREVRENKPFLKRIAALENSLRKIEREELSAPASDIKNELNKVIVQCPHKINNKPIEPGMRKPGNQSHIHLIVSRKDISNTYSLSPGSKYRSSEVVMHGKLVRRGFDRDKFFQTAEKTFDRLFNYQRNFVESYDAKKILAKDPQKFYSSLQHLTPAEKKIALKLMDQAGLKLPMLNLNPNQASFVLKQIKRAIGVAVRSSSIGY